MNTTTSPRHSAQVIGLTIDQDDKNKLNEKLSTIEKLQFTWESTFKLAEHYLERLAEIVVVGGNVIQSFVSAGEVHPDLREVSRHYLASQQLTAEKIQNEGLHKVRIDFWTFDDAALSLLKKKKVEFDLLDEKLSDLRDQFRSKAFIENNEKKAKKLDSIAIALINTSEEHQAAYKYLRDGLNDFIDRLTMDLAKLMKLMLECQEITGAAIVENIAHLAEDKKILKNHVSQLRRSTMSLPKTVQLTSQQILKNLAIKKHFLEFCDKQHNSENILFLEEISVFKAMSPYSKRLLSKSKQIIEKFIDPVDGVQIQPINIDGNTTNTIKSNIIDEKVTLELFNQAVKEIETIVNTSIIPKFLNSDIFRDKVDPLIKLSITYYRETSDEVLASAARVISNPLAMDYFTHFLVQQSGVILINLLLDIEKALRSPQREYDALAKAIEKQLFEDEELVQTLKGSSNSVETNFIEDEIPSPQDLQRMKSLVIKVLETKYMDEFLESKLCGDFAARWDNARLEFLDFHEKETQRKLDGLSSGQESDSSSNKEITPEQRKLKLMRTKSLIERSAIPSFPPPEESNSPKTLKILEDKRESRKSMKSPRKVSVEAEKVMKKLNKKTKKRLRSNTLSLKISGADMQMMEAILKDPNGLPVLLEFVAGSPEESALLNFYLDVENLNKLEDEAQIKEMIDLIWQSYFVQEILPKLDQEITKSLKKKFAQNQEIDKTVFDKARTNVFELMASYIYPRFILNQTIEFSRSTPSSPRSMSPSWSSLESSPNGHSNSSGSLNSPSNPAKGRRSPSRRSLRSSKSASYLPIQNEIDSDRPSQKEPSSIEKIDLNRREPERKTSFKIPGNGKETNSNNNSNNTNESGTNSKKGKEVDPLSQSESGDRFKSSTRKEKSKSDKKKKKRSISDEDMKKAKPVKSSSDLISSRNSSKESLNGSSSNLTRSLSTVTKSSTNSLFNSNK
jgi:hypothetical protein